VDLLLIRHAESEGNVNGATVAEDWPLTARGRQQAEALALRLVCEGVRPDAIFASPMLRALQTADIVARGLGAVFQVMTDLAEVSIADCEGLTVAEAEKRFPGLVVEAPGQSSLRWRFPGGESLGELRERGRQAMASLAALRERGARVVVAVSHGFLLSQGLAGFLGVPPSPFTQFSWDNTAIARLVLADGRVPKLALLNDTRHLDDLAD